MGTRRITPDNRGMGCTGSLNPLMIDEQRLFLSADEVANSPSRQQGMSEMDEFAYRCFACELIREGQIWLELYAISSLLRI